jgi:RHS repeat-associated protein
MYVAQEHSIYGSSRVGVDNSKDTLYLGAVYTTTWGGVGTSRRELGLKSFELANHLGNVLVTVSDKPIYKVSSGTIYFQPEITSTSDYYPFGAPIQGRSFSSTEIYRFGFNGKEIDHESETQDYGMRIYDCRLGRFLSVDPVSMDYAWNSVYAFAENRVVLMIDLEGKEGYYPDPTAELWKASGLTTSSATQICENTMQVVKTVAKYGGPALAITGGAFGMAVIVGAEGLSVSLTVVGTLSNTMALVGGTIQEIAIVAERSDLIDKIPTSYFGGMALSIELMTGNDSRTFSGIVSFAEGICTWQPQDLKGFEEGLKGLGYTTSAINALKGGIELGPDVSTSIQSAVDNFNSAIAISGGGTSNAFSLGGSSNLTQSESGNDWLTVENKKTNINVDLLDKITVPKSISCHTKPELTISLSSHVKTALPKVNLLIQTPTPVKPYQLSETEKKEMMNYFKSIPTNLNKNQ